MFRSKSWFGWNRPKIRLSLDHLKYLHTVLERNTTVSENNRNLLVESLRCIAEILIWGDQNDSSVFDFFLEKNMLSYFLHIMRQKSGGSSYVCVQLLQTLNILFENIRNETSLYYLLSNNHVNSIIVHKFDFSDEDVMGYYILFLKTLSLKLNTHTIHFFYNEHTNDFPLYTEAIKFFNHPESMVRIAVRTISLNVYKVENTSMLQFIRDKTAAPYFSNLVWFIGKHILELDTCVRNDIDHQSQHRLANLVAEHLDHLHYLNDILCLDISDLNAVLTEHLLHKLFVPLYIYSLTPAPPLTMALVTQNLAAVLNKHVDIDDLHEINNPRVSSVVALFLLSLVFLVITHGPLVHSLTWVILNADHNVFKNGAGEILNSYVTKRGEVVALGFGQPQESLEEALESTISTPSRQRINTEESTSNSSYYEGASHRTSLEHVNITDEEKEKLRENSTLINESSNRPFLDVLLTALDCMENDYITLLDLCLIYALANNKGVSSEWLDQILNKCSSTTSKKYKMILVDKLLQIINLSSQPSCRIRLITLELSIKIFCQFIHLDAVECALLESHHNSIYSAYNQCMTVLRNFYKSEDIFLDLFEDEYNEMTKSNLNVEFLCMDATILLPPTGTPLTGINFTRRLPCGEVEKARRAIRVYFYLRKLCQTITYDSENLLPLTNPDNCVKESMVLDLNNSDLIACTVVLKDATKLRQFLVIDVLQLILVEPDTKRLGWGVAKLVGFLQDVEVNGDKEDSRCLHITVHRGGATTNRIPILSAKFIFDDHIRCMAAKQRLTKGRSKARQKKMLQIAQLLEISGQTGGNPIGLAMYSNLQNNGGGSSSNSGIGGVLRGGLREHRPLFTTFSRMPGVAAALRRENMPSGSVSRYQMPINRTVQDARRIANTTAEPPRNRSDSPKGSNNSNNNNNNTSNNNRSRDPSKNRTSAMPRSRDGSARTQRPRSEEIPLEDFRQSRNSSPVSRIPSNVSSRSNTPSPMVIAAATVTTLTDSFNNSGKSNTTNLIRDNSPSTSNSCNSSTSSGANAMNISAGDTNNKSSEETSFIAQGRKLNVEIV